MERQVEPAGSPTMRVTWTDALSITTDVLLVQNPGRVFHAMSRDFEATLIRCALTAAGGCRLEAARLLGISRTTVSRRIDELGLGAFATPYRRDRNFQDRF